jgi:cyclopropane fatty-acyl-phospholipid synthase-like methyltransferase
MAQCQQRDITELLLKLDAGKDPWPLPASSYHTVASAGLLEYFTPDMLQHFLRESEKILIPKGLLVFTYVPSEAQQNTTKIWNGKSGSFLSCAYVPADLEKQLIQRGFSVLEHSDPFPGSVFRDGSSYSYRLVTAQKNEAASVR